MAPREAGDLLVVAVINDTWADHVVSVAGGDVASWSQAAAPFYDDGDGQIMQIRYGVTSSAGAANLAITWNGTTNNADIAVQEFTAGAGASWSFVATGSSASPFPALNSPESGTLYIGAAMAWGNGARWDTPGVTYTVPSPYFLLSWDTDASGTLAPAANGSGSVAALFSATTAAHHDGQQPVVNCDVHSGGRAHDNSGSHHDDDHDGADDDHCGSAHPHRRRGGASQPDTGFTVAQQPVRQ